MEKFKYILVVGNLYKQKLFYTKKGILVQKMEQTNQKWNKILELLFEYPRKDFTVREISKKIKIPSSSVQRYLKKLRTGGLIKENKLIINTYSKFLKAFFIINKIYKTNLIDYLHKELNPSVIILFGSIRKGEYDYESDIDLFVESPIRKDIDLKKFEKKLNHKIQLFIYSDINKLQPNLFNNVINGIRLFGAFKLK